MAKRKTGYKLDEKGERVPLLDAKNKQKIGAKNRKMWEREDAPANNWNTKETLVEWRKAWAENVNAYLPKDKHIDHRTLEAQGIDREPTAYWI